jgi:hypothetical protein
VHVRMGSTRTHIVCSVWVCWWVAKGEGAGEDAVVVRHTCWCVPCQVVLAVGALCLDRSVGIGRTLVRDVACWHGRLQYVHGGVGRCSLCFLVSGRSLLVVGGTVVCSG